MTILKLYKLAIRLIQHQLKGSTKDLLIDQIGMCAAKLLFAERSTYIRIQMKEGAQGAQQFDPSYYGIRKSGLSQSTSRPIFRNCDGTTTADSAADDVYFDSKLFNHFFSRQLIPRPQIQQLFQGFGMYLGMYQFQGFLQPELFQQTQLSGYSIQLYRQPSITEGIPKFKQNPLTFGLQQTQQSNLLTDPTSCSIDHPAFQSNFQSQSCQQLIQQYNQLTTIGPLTLVHHQTTRFRNLDTQMVDQQILLEQPLQEGLRKTFSHYGTGRAHTEQTRVFFLNIASGIFNRHQFITILYSLRFLGPEKLYIKIRGFKINCRTAQKI
ncbi:MAG: hypothetical protein EZS28_001695 [Streblomastix strix]|uniref:Uncharacterized protein n=1 Tax=Streblomastix strix TaxID=222440 RepID=A0A5J4X852_9EUKA|nr:MAG: hypothetical protein EZS28_001695 [Streblomastix strix]